MDRKALARALYERTHIKGDFTLRSGSQATEYFDKYRFEAEPHLLQAVAEALVPLVPQTTQVLAGLEMGGIPIATALALLTGLPLRFIRKLPKAYGTMRLAEGGDVVGLRLVIIEDVVTSGGQVVESVVALRDLGAKVDHVVCVIDRHAGGGSALEQIGVELLPLFSRDDLFADDLP